MTVEESIKQLGDERAKQFWSDCAAVFGSGIGARVLRTLCEISHPLESPLRGTEGATAAEIGRKEVVAALWRRSADRLTPEKQPLTEPKS